MALSSDFAISAAGKEREKPYNQKQRKKNPHYCWLQHQAKLATLAGNHLAKTPYVIPNANLLKQNPTLNSMYLALKIFHLAISVGFVRQHHHTKITFPSSVASTKATLPTKVPIATQANQKLVQQANLQIAGAPRYL